MLPQESEPHYGGEVGSKLLAPASDGAATFQLSNTMLDGIAPALALSVEAARAPFPMLPPLPGQMLDQTPRRQRCTNIGW
jgi:hypothetical protein